MPVSIEQLTVAPASAANVNVGRGSPVVPVGPPVIDSDGAAVSTVNERVCPAERCAC